MKDRKSPKFNIGGYATINGNINENYFRQAITKVIDSQSLLRATIELDGAEAGIFKFPDDAQYIELQVFDFSVDDNSDEKAISWMKADMQVPFPTVFENLFSTTLIRAANYTYWYVKFHHLINDGYGLSIFFKSVLGQYNSISNPNALEKCDYGRFQNVLSKNISDPGYLASKLFWNHKYRLLPEFQQLDKALSKKVTSGVYSFNISGDLLNKCKQFGLEHKLSFLHLFLGSLTIYLYKRFSYNNFPVVLPVQNRSSLHAKHTVGPFVSLIPLKLAYHADRNILEFLTLIKREIISCLRHKDYQLGELLADLNITGNNARNFSRFRVSYEKHDYDYFLNDHDINVFPLSNRHEEADLSVHIRDYTAKSDQLIVDFDFNEQVFPPGRMESLANSLQLIIDQFIESPLGLLKSLNVLSEEETLEQTAYFTKTTAYLPYPSLKKRIDRSFELNAERIFLSTANGHLKYREIDELANRISACLVNKYGLDSLGHVGLYLDDKCLYIQALYGLIKSGAVYVPIDMSYPRERVLAIIRSSGCSYIITDSLAGKGFIIEAGFELLLIHELLEEENISFKSDIKPTDPLYLISTSGSTGIPKGAVCTNMGFNNLLSWYVDTMGLTSSDRTLIISSLGFDLTQKNIFAPALVGGSLHLLEDNFYDPARILEFIRKYNISWINCTPSTFYPLVRLELEKNHKSLETLKYVVLGGEPINMSLLASWYNNPECSTVLVNSYGPTECTDVTNYYIIPKQNDYTSSVIPIGKAIHNVVSYILDSELSLLPAGAVGEICIGGIAVGNGYWNDETKTAEKFLLNPFGEGRLYRTGDLGRWLADGNIEYLGRMDDQVKIRGYRIELGEIEAAVLAFEGIREA
ncbi:amino acid adenylation domain-containing protein, partial [Mucilaginibacter sp. SG538B]|uniref:non-ribosomal peptide synthetase n=1 Tax=Mucilaginibacter sp. SG538B TaxID=2587021 RepID=UPI00159D32E9